MIEGSTFKKLSILTALGILAALSLLILWPILISIIAGLILVYTFNPLYKKVLYIVKERNTSAFIVILLTLLLIFIPLWFLLPAMIKQIFDIYLYLQNTNIAELLKSMPGFSNSISTDFAISFNSFFSSIASKLFAGMTSLLLDLPSLLLKMVVVLFVFFFGMRDSELFMNYVQSLSPFSKSTEKEFTKKFKDITSSVIYGYVVLGILQGLLTGIGIYIAGIPRALFLTIIAMIAAMIPIGGAFFVWVPATIYLFTIGRTVAGVVLALYGIIVVSQIDNVIRPYLVAKKTKISTAIVLIGMIGGVIVFGILGLIIGPLIFSYLLLILDAYRNKKFPDLFSEQV